MDFRIFGAITLLIGSIACAKLSSSSPGDLKPRDSPVAVGEIAPDFTLDDQNNQKVTLSSARGGMPTVLVFYRGYW